MSGTGWNDYEDDGGKATNVNSKDWENELFGCADDLGTFFFACACPCFAAGEIYSNASLGHCCVGFSLWCFLLGACHPCLVTSKIRNDRGIRGSFVSDCFTICCCAPCQLTREIREVREVKEVREERGY
eukprot:316713_1